MFFKRKPFAANLFPEFSTRKHGKRLAAKVNHKLDMSVVQKMLQHQYVLTTTQQRSNTIH
jgi:hypothetical protein